MKLFIPPIYNNYNIVSIDPGLNNLGIAIFNMKSTTSSDLFNDVNTIEAFTLKNDKLKDPAYITNDICSDRYIKLAKIQEAMNYILNRYRPNQVLCESPFFNRLRPSAYASLVEVINTIQYCIYQYNTNVYFKTVEPLLVKKRVGAGYVNGKQDMKTAIMNKPEIISKLKNDVNLLDEHAIDAIAIGYGYLKSIGEIK